MKKRIINLIILFIAIILVLYFTLKDNFKSIMIELKQVNILIFIVAIVVFLLSILLRAACLKTFLREYDPSYSLKKAFEMTVIAQFLNGITPFQTGGQPFQVFLLKKEGIRIADSTSALIKDFIAFQISLILIGILALISNISIGLFTANKYLNILIFLGFVVNLIILVILLFISGAKKTGTKVLNKILDFVFKLRITKKLKVSRDELDNSLKRFYEAGTDIRNNKSTLYKGILCHSSSLILQYIIPMIIFYSLGMYKINVIQSITATAFVILIGNFIPIPGATGGIEYGFMQFFGNFIKGPILSGAMLLWRGITYIFGMLIGSVALLLRKDRN